ncbi:hypothetical protein UREG_03597 [Uncinocarpus reesii 1704]|uniref:[Histone H3]-trimethyl-L-lysine(9) demethylase n=1 Tax=Uncinocarpus reesii (strain UAMH 1704) TaxID=336963 RepID=C4JL89_UNCRE|nr:uncharacterized protein UREG_03597 [Uncinocarpus reesii 1704]EEP78751.1 hypothetical protein UREG_03597 [Uncinocarpus reesii 1704]
METQHPVLIGDPASMTPPASADGEKPSPCADSPRGSDMGLDSASVDDDDIQPDHYYGGGKIPVFRPNMDQFRDFQAFIRKVNKYGMRSGVVKVIPPQEWNFMAPMEPIRRRILENNGLIIFLNGKALCEETSHQPPARRGERRRVQEKPARGGTRGQTARSDSQKRKPGPANPKPVEPEKIADGFGERKLEGPPTPVSPQSNPVEPKSEELSDGESLPAPKPKGRQPKSVTARRKYNRGDAMDFVDEEAFKDFDYHLSGNEDYTAERCEELETAYWKSLMYNNPMYGADMPGSLFDDSVTSWNVAKLPNLLDILGQKVPGVNTAYLYLGMWKATFAWHLEDVDLYSINFIHFGAPKQWYSISQEDLPRFEAAMKKQWLDYARVAKKCNCESDSVWIDIREIERKLRGEATPEYYDELDDQLEGASDLLTPPRSVPEKSASRKKRKHDNSESKTKRVKLHLEGPRKIPCILCPNNLDYEELLPTEDGLYHAHRRCALYIDETSILKDESGKEIVEFGEISVTADDGCEYTVPGVDLKCKYHRPKRLGSQSPEAMDMDFKLTETAKRLRSGDLVQFQADKEINGAVVLENRPEERALLLKVLPRGDVIELPYRWILIVKKSSFLPLPPGIKPLPAHLARKPEARKDLASTIPSHGTPFGDPWLPYQWAEFSCVKPPFNPHAARVDIFKPEQIWYYLGRTSTECRAQYTDNPAGLVHNPRSNFLESVKSLRATAATISHPHAFSTKQPKYHPGLPATTPVMSTLTRPVVTTQSQPLPASNIPARNFNDAKGMQFMTARRLIVSITEHANSGAGYTIVDPDFVAQLLLGESSSAIPKNGIEKLKKAMVESMIRPRSSNGLLPLQPLNMEADEVDHLLRMLRFAIVDLAQKINGNDSKVGKLHERQTVKETHLPSSSVGLWGSFDASRRQPDAVYNSPYAPGFGFSEYAIREYGLGPQRLAQKEHSAADFFSKLSQEDKEKVIQACGGVTSSRKDDVDIPIAPGLEMSQVSGLENPNTTISMDVMNIDPHHLSVFDMTLHADSPASSFSRTAIQYQSPQDFSAHVEHESSLLPRHFQDHHDLFGDQQTNQRFWQRSVPWNDGDTPSHNDEHRPFFGPHLPPAGHDYPSSDMDFERGPGSLHSMDMAGFGFDGTDELFPNPSP